MRRNKSLTSGPVRKQLFGLAGPMVMGLLAIMVFNLVDTWFVSKLGTAQLAAISMTFPVVMIIGSISRGLGIGATSVVSRAIGSGNHGEVRRLTTDALLLGVGIVLVVSVVGWFTIDPLFRLMGADDTLLPLVREYMSVWYLGAAFVVVPMIGNSAIRASGDTRTPAMVMILAGVLNAGLDPLLIFGWGPVPAMGIRGAAIATIASRALTLVVALWVLGKRQKMIARHFEGLKATLASWKRIIEVGVPAGAANLAQPITAGILTAMVADYGKTAVAAFGAGGRVEMIVLIPLIALGTGLTPFVGQNWGAREKGRVAEALGYGLYGSVVLGLVGYGLVALFAHPIAGLFSDDPAVLRLLVRYLWILPAAHWAVGVIVTASCTFNAIGRPLAAASITLVRAPVLTAIFALLGSYVAGVPGIYIGTVAATVLAGVAGWLWMRPLRRAEPATH